MSEHTPWDEGDAKAVFDCLKYHAAAGGEYEYRGTLAIEAFTRICIEVARLRADNDEIDEVCTKRQLEIYRLEAEIAKLRAEREVVLNLAALWDSLPGKESFAPAFAEELRAALAEKV